MSKSVRACACVILAALMAFLAAAPAFAADETAGRTVRVAVYNNSILAYRDGDGVWRGTDVECLTNIAQRTGLKLEFVDSTNDADFLAHLDSGYYDIVADVNKTPEREKKYLFSEMSPGTMTTSLSVRADDDRWDYGDTEQISSMRVGVIKSYANNASFRAWCAERGLKPVIREYENIDEMTQALSGGEIDGEVYSSMFGTNYVTEFRSVLEFLPEEYYYVFRRGDMALKSAVDEAMSQIVINNNNYLTELNNKYAAMFGSISVPLSAEEKKYVAQNPTVTVAVLENDEPYYYQSADGTQHGIVPDYYELLTDYSGLAFRYAVYPTQEQAVAAVNSGEADLVAVFSNGIIAASQSGLALTEKLTSVSDVLLTKSGTDTADIKTVAVKKRAMSALKSMNAGFLSQTELLAFESAGDCFGAMRSGKTDAAILGMPSATWLLNQTNNSLYSVTSLPGMPLDLCAALRKTDTTLCSIMNKSIAATRESIDAVITRDTLPKDNWITNLNRIPNHTVIVFTGVLALLVVGLVWSMVMLRRRQKERTAVLAVQAETERQKLQVESLQKSAEEKNAFFSNISHDMRTPLNAILGFIRLAKKDGLPAEQRREYLNKAESSGELMLDLINDTLTLSKASSGKLQVHPEPIRGRELFASVIDPIREAAEKKNVVFTADYSQALDRAVMADRLNVQKIFLNLLSNAVKYTPAGGHVSLKIYNEPAADGTPDSILAVSDDGIGISEEFLPHIYEPFTQEKRTGYESVGTGLGLSIVKQLVDLMGGTIDVQSEKGKGTTFTVRLHFEEADAADVSGTAPASAADTDLTGKKILLCEDNALNREIAVALLKDGGMEVTAAENGRLGVQRFSDSARGEFSAVLMDVRMPEMDGYTATAAIRALGRPDAETIPIIAMTADAYADDIDKCIAAGMDGHIAKPIDPSALFMELRKNIR